MPGNVQLASPATVMPFALCRAFSRSQDLPVQVNDYRQGESQRRALAETPRRRWTITQRLCAAKLVALREFYEDRKGPLEPFFFYDLWETSPPFTWDPQGVSLQGRYTVRFDTHWEQATDMARSDVTVSLVEIA